MNIQNESFNILVDPSILISKNAFEKFLILKDKIDIPKKEYFVPASFKDVLSEAEANLDVIIYFRGGARSVNLPYLREKLWEIKMVPFSPSKQHIQKYSMFYENLLNNIKNKKLLEYCLKNGSFCKKSQ